MPEDERTITRHVTRDGYFWETIEQPPPDYEAMHRLWASKSMAERLEATLRYIRKRYGPETDIPPISTF